ncbi:hypothetical protein EVAR_26433_1 [Eumeta japonica]|uniref:Uncharacterized protein n=1 Tax=Eumeta variegata TaxID=151549 RepID=A0A4C1VRG9_EUMVA|nr:hypothetical protein EVAR_26433_1 [Eumeta japonica]
MASVISELGVDFRSGKMIVHRFILTFSQYQLPNFITCVQAYFVASLALTSSAQRCHLDDLSWRGAALRKVSRSANNENRPFHSRAPACEGITQGATVIVTSSKRFHGSCVFRGARCGGGDARARHSKAASLNWKIQFWNGTRSEFRSRRHGCRTESFCRSAESSPKADNNFRSRCLKTEPSTSVPRRSAATNDPRHQFDANILDRRLSLHSVARKSS